MPPFPGIKNGILHAVLGKKGIFVAKISLGIKNEGRIDVPVKTLEFTRFKFMPYVHAPVHALC